MAVKSASPRRVLVFASQNARVGTSNSSAKFNSTGSQYIAAIRRKEYSVGQLCKHLEQASPTANCNLPLDIRPNKIAGGFGRIYGDTKPKQRPEAIAQAFGTWTQTALCAIQPGEFHKKSSSSAERLTGILPFTTLVAPYSAQRRLLEGRITRGNAL